MRTALIAAALTFSAHATVVEIAYGTYFIESDTANIQEGAVTQQVTTSNGNNMLTNTSTKDGYYASFLGTKWSAEWMVWPVNNKEHCEGYCLPSPVAAQPYLVGGAFLRESRWNGRDVQVWTSPAVSGVVDQTFFMDKATGNPVAMQSSDAGIAVQYTTFVPGAAMDPALPSACVNVKCAPVPTIPPATGRAKAHGVRAARLTYAALGANGALHRQLAQLPRYAAPRGFAAARAVDSRVYATGVRNQGMCGGCWAFATAASTEIVFNKARNVTAAAAPEWLSVQTILDCVHGEDKGGLISAKGCQGGSPLTAMDFIAKHGIARDMDYPFASVSHRTCRLPAVAEKVRPLQGMMSLGRGDLAARMAAVEQHGAFVVIINVIGSFEAYSSATGAVYSDPQCTPGLAHAVTVVGYGTSAKGEDYWIIKNSWTAGWGDAGYIYMARGVNMCGVEDFGFVPVANNRTTAH